MAKNISKVILKHSSLSSDEENMRCFSKDGNEEAFEKIYNKYFPLLSKYLNWLIGDYEMARDCCQNILVKLYQNPNLFDNQRNFKVWIFSIANNQWKNHLRNQSTREREKEELKYQLKVVDEEFESNENQIRLAQISEGLKGLTEKHKEVFLLKYSNNLSLEEISHVCQCSIGTVKSRLFYAMKYLKEFIAKEKV